MFLVTHFIQDGLLSIRRDDCSSSSDDDFPLKDRLLSTHSHVSVTSLHTGWPLTWKTWKSRGIPRGRGKWKSQWKFGRNWNQFYLNLKNICEMRQNAPFPIQNSNKNFLGKGTAHPYWEGTPLPKRHPREATTVDHSIKLKSQAISCSG